MNERTKELAEQAFNEANNGSINNIKIPKEFVEKFAELIVRECCDLMQGFTFEEIATKVIKKNFGVEE